MRSRVGRGRSLDRLAVRARRRGCHLGIPLADFYAKAGAQALDKAMPAALCIG